MEVLQKIRACITTNRDRLAYATRNAPVSTFAWLARNLLELAIWAEYCRSSPERSYQFLLDGARDAYDALDIPADLVLDSEHLKLRETLVERAATDGFDIEESYKKVITAAKELNRRDWFRHLNKTFPNLLTPPLFPYLRWEAMKSTYCGKSFRD